MIDSGKCVKDSETNIPGERYISAEALNDEEEKKNDKLQVIISPKMLEVG